MTSGSFEPSVVKMTATGQSDRFASSFSTGNGRDKPSQTIPTQLQSQGWLRDAWSSESYGKRAATGSRDSNDPFANGASGSGALAASSQADSVWGPPSTPWNNTTNGHPRNASGNTSPGRPRDTSQSINDYGSNPFLTTRSTIGQGGNFVTRPNLSSRDRFDSVYDNMGDLKDTNGSFSSFGNDTDSSLRGYGADKRTSQDHGYSSVVGGPTRDNNGFSSSSIEVNQQSNSSFGNLPSLGAFGAQPSNSALSQRPLIHNSNSFPTQTHNQRAYNANNGRVPDDDLAEKFRRSLTLDESSRALSNNARPLHSFPASSQSQPFQFDPGSQPWEVRDAHSSYGPDTYADGNTIPFSAMKRPSMSITDRGSTPASAYHQLNSPKTFGTPPTHTPPWSRPGSRDIRAAPEPERRAQEQAFSNQHAANYFGQPGTGYAGQHYYDQTYPQQQFQPQMIMSTQYGPQGFRPALLSGNGYGMHVNPYMPGPAGTPIRPGKDQDPAKGARSFVLEEFRSNSKSNKKYDLKDIYYHIVEFSGDQHGSRFIQTKLETANSDEKEQVFREIEPNAVQLMKDVFGNYVIQKFFEHGNQVQKKLLASHMRGKVVDLSMQMYACRVVQKALEHVLVEQQAELVKELESDVLRVMRDQNGNHVIQKIIELVPQQHISFIMDALRSNVYSLSVHMYGCRVVQRMLEHGSEQSKRAIMKELHSCASMLITDQYGNYVAQHVIQHGDPEDRSRMINIVVDQLVALSKHKFASNVVEKCIEHGTVEDRSRICRELMSVDGDGETPLQTMIKDQYGNYVIQKLLGRLEGYERDSFLDEVKPQWSVLKKVTGGKQVAALERLFAAMTPPNHSAKKESGGGNVGSPALASPGLQVDVNSTSPTPNLTMEPNTPQSSSPPSTKASANEDFSDGSSTVKMGSTNGLPGTCPEVRVDEV